jgi:hypothetical protein
LSSLVYYEILTKQKRPSHRKIYFLSTVSFGKQIKEIKKRTIYKLIGTTTANKQQKMKEKKFSKNLFDKEKTGIFIFFLFSVKTELTGRATKKYLYF